MQHLTVVISGFGPYPDLRVNPAYEVPDALAGEQWRPDADDEDFLDDLDVHVIAVHVPISFSEAWSTLRRTVEQDKPQIVIATGVKHASRGISLERCAINQVDPRGRDAHDTPPRSGPINEQGPAALWTRMPLRAILRSFAQDDIPATLSSDAGTYVCNSLFYELLNWTVAQDRVLSGFVSLPIVVQSQDEHHGLTMQQQIRAGRHVVVEALRYYRRPSSDDILLV